MATTMHFGPEWMRTKHQLPSRSQPPPSPPPVSVPASGTSTYSALVSPAPALQVEERDEAHPFRYSKEEMLRIYREGGGKGGLGLEVEKWEGVVREVGVEPVSLREMGDAEKKRFAGPLNSDLRRRQSTDYLSPISTQTLGADRPRLNHTSSASGTSSPMRERFGTLMGRKRDSTEPSPAAMPRKPSFSTTQGPLASPRDIGLPSPRTRVGLTPTFDGVLSGGDSWVARRRTSEGLLRAGGSGATRDLGGEYQPESKGPDIRQEEEGNSSVTEQEADARDSSITLHPPGSSSPDTSFSGSGESQELIPPENQSLNTSMSHLSLTGAGTSTHSLTSSSIVPGPSPGVSDLANVEWSYLDPQGQVQGPFRADLIQKWYDDGYFAMDLLMKRTHIDTEWLEVRELARRAGGDKIFLSPSMPTLSPPGLSRSTESPLQGFSPLADQNSFSGPYQPAPVRSLRSSTLDYLATGSNPSDSPSSFNSGSFGAGPPDSTPAAFSGRTNIDPHSTRDPSVAGRVGSFVTAPEIPSAFSGGQRNAVTDSSPGPSFLAPSSGHMVPGRETAMDNHSFNDAFNSTQGPWQASTSNLNGSGFDALNIGGGSGGSMPNFGPTPSAALGTATGFSNISAQDASFNSNDPRNAPFLVSDYSNVGELRISSHPGGPVPNDKISFNYDGHGNVTFGGSSQFQHPQSSSGQYPTSQQQHLTPPLSNVFGHHTPVPNTSLLEPQGAQHNTDLTSGTPHSPWDNIPEPTRMRRPGPFDATHPTALNTSKVASSSIVSSQQPPWVPPSQPSRPAPLKKTTSPWFAASQSVVEEHWIDEPRPDTSNLSSSNHGQPTQQQQQPETPAEANTIVPHVPDQPQRRQQTVVPEPAQPSEATSNITAGQTSKARTKSTTSAGQKQVSALKSIPSSPQIPETPPSPSAPLKSAWLNEEETKKAKSAANSLSLREIQVAEAKKSEDRKIAERERERTARTSAATVSEEVQSFTASWGLPTSQVGARLSSSASQKEVSSSSSSSAISGPPVWTTGSKPAATKKTMKEIQEEEERRKKLASKETVAAAAARRAYAETTNKHNQPVQSSAWTTVGPSGKPSAAVSTPVRPSITPSTSSSHSIHSISRTNGSNARPSAAPTVAKASQTAARVEDHPASPSHSFLKWLSDSLKGLNSSVNVEEIMSMLLSFPMDPDPSTVELISDLIYANSTTLDGRRFASEFVSRRKADAASRPKGAGIPGTAAGKSVSIADVVKAQPKSTQPEWGGFKVVNKKKKSAKP